MRGRLVALAAGLLIGLLTVIPAHAQNGPYLTVSNETPVPGDLIIVRGYGFCGPPCSAVRVTRGEEWLGDVTAGADGRFMTTYLASGSGWVRIAATQQTSDLGRSAHVDQFVAIADDFESEQGSQGSQGLREAFASPSTQRGALPSSRRTGSPIAARQGSAFPQILAVALFVVVALGGVLSRRRRVPAGN